MVLAVAHIEHFQPFSQIKAILGDTEAMSERRLFPLWCDYAEHRLSKVRQTHKQRCQAKATRANNSNHERKLCCTKGK